MPRNLLFALFVLACLTIACDGTDGVPLAGDGAGIVGGTPTNGEIWKGVVGVVSLSGGQPAGICTGTLIRPDVVLTAGHCVKLVGDGLFTPSYDHVAHPEELQVKAGANIGPRGGKGTLLSLVTEAIAHPTWEGELDPGNAVDLALLHLATPVTDIGHYCVRHGGAPPAYQDAGIIVGYGLLASNQTNSAGIQRWGDTTILSVEDKVIGIGDPTATCQGDSGGPLFTEVDGRWEVTGVTSYGQGLTCQATSGAFSANSFNYFAWLDEVVTGWTGEPLESCTLFGPTDEELPTDEEPTDSAGDAGTGDTAEEDTGTVPADAGADAGSDGGDSSSCRATPAAPSSSLLAHLAGLLVS